MAKVQDWFVIASSRLPSVFGMRNAGAICFRAVFSLSANRKPWGNALFKNPRLLMLGSVRAIILSLWFLESVFPLPQFSALTGTQTKMAKGLAICCGVLLTLAFLCPGALGDWIFSLKITRFVNGDGRLANGKPIETDFTFDVLRPIVRPRLCSDCLS